MRIIRLLGIDSGLGSVGKIVIQEIDMGKRGAKLGTKKGAYKRRDTRV